MQIKTLAQILAESDTDSASASARPKQEKKHSTTQSETSAPPKKNARSNTKKSRSYSKQASEYVASSRAYHSAESGTADTHTASDDIMADPATHAPKRSRQSSKKRQKRFHPAATFVPQATDTPAYQPPKTQSIKEMLSEVKQAVHGSEVDSTDHAADTDTVIEAFSDDSSTDNLPAALKAYLRTPEQRQAEADAIKAESRLRWLAFYYLSRREYGRAELRQKLLDKEQDPEQIDNLLDEFADKGYQSDYRTTLMLIRESIRKGRGRGHIKREFYRKKVAMPSNIDELIDMANNESDEFQDFIDQPSPHSDGSDNGAVDWLKLAVTARTKKYGSDIPTTPKDKAKQLRFLQYRGFQGDICFQALGHTLETLEERD